MLFWRISTFLLSVWCNNICKAKAALQGHNNEAAMSETACCSAVEFGGLNWRMDKYLLHIPLLKS